jgi:hypothetical protein
LTKIEECQSAFAIDSTKEIPMMKVLVLAVLSFGLGFGCVADEQEPLPSEALGQVEQNVGEPCSGHYMCRLGEECRDTTATCQSYFVIGPAANPCIDTLQCQYQYSRNSYCYYRDQGPYGECRLY